MCNKVSAFNNNMEIPELYPRDIATTRAARLHQGAGQKGEAARGLGRVHEGEGLWEGHDGATESHALDR